MISGSSKECGDLIDAGVGYSSSSSPVSNWRPVCLHVVLIDPQMMPLCVDFKILHGNCAARPCAAIWGTIEVGIVRAGVIGEPRFWGMILGTRLEYGTKDWDSTEKLSELPRLLEKLNRY